MVNPIEAVLFDYGLVLTGPPCAAAWARMQAVTRVPDPRFEAAYWAPRHDYDRGALTGEAYWLAVGAHAGLALEPAQVDALIDADNELWTQPNQPMIDWAARLQAAGTPTGILSNLGDSMTAGVLDRLEWLSGFDHRTFSHALGIAKPDPAIYAHAIAGLRVPAAHILFVDDREDNLSGARDAGMQVIRYTGLASHAAFVSELEQRGLGGLWTLGLPGERLGGGGM